MTSETPASCSLAANDLERRLAAIAAVGAEGLIDRGTVDGRHRLRFRSDRRTRQRLESIVAAERECCAFLELSLTADGEGLVLSIAAPENGQALADELARAFGERPR